MLWFPSLQQVSYLWEEISWLQQCLSPSQTSCSCTLQTRLKMLQAVAHLQVAEWFWEAEFFVSKTSWTVVQILCDGFHQGALGTQDLGQVYFEPIKDKHGNGLLVLLKDMNTSPNLDGVRWTQLCKLQLQRKSISSPEEPTALDMLLITLHVSHKGLKIWLYKCLRGSQNSETTPNLGTMTTGIFVNSICVWMCGICARNTKSHKVLPLLLGVCCPDIRSPQNKLTGSPDCRGSRLAVIRGDLSFVCLAIFCFCFGQRMLPQQFMSHLCYPRMWQDQRVSSKGLCQQQNAPKHVFSGIAATSLKALIHGKPNMAWQTWGTRAGTTGLQIEICFQLQVLFVQTPFI